MYLKRIELQGFKSFPDKLALDFDNVMAVIVGPNGSGKSNIADAVRWVLGEQSVKSLRGQKWEDVIFAGTANRRALNFAEVSLTLDNKDGSVDSIYTDVTVTRKVFRSGESEYLINGKNCRLKDIRELFMDTGVGKEGYSIIGQGRIDEILNARSDERRQIFEEASGIVKFKTRRQEAFSKLENERKNLVRVNDIISEIEMTIEPLMDQAEVARKFLDLSERLKLYQVNLFIIEEQRLKSEIQRLKAIYDSNLESIEEKNLKHSEYSEKVRVMKADGEELESLIKALRENIYENRSAQEQKQNDIKIKETEIYHFQKDIERLNEEICGLNERSRKNRDEIRLSESKISRERLLLLSNEEMLLKASEEFDKLNEYLSASEVEIEKSKTDIIENIKEASEIKSDLIGLSAVNEQAKERASSIRIQKAKADDALAIKKTEIEALENDLCAKDAEHQNLLARRKVLQDTKDSLVKQRASLQTEFDKTTKDIIKSKERMKVLTVMAQEREGFVRSVKEILNAALINLVPGIKGVTGEVISVKKEHEIAIEIALGAAIQNIITKDEISAKKAIDYLKRNNFGRATFLPLNTIKSAQPIPESLLARAGIVGAAKKLVSYDDEFEPVMSNLLERVVVAENMNTAIEFSKKTAYKYKIVTLGGEVISTQGAMTGGSLNEKRINIFSRNREINELEDRLKELYKTREAIELNISSAETSIAKTKSELDSVYEKTEEASLAVNMLKQRLESEKSETLSIREQITALISEEGQIDSKLSEYTEELTKKRLQLEKLEALGIEIEEKISEKQVLNQSDKEQRDQKLAEIADLRIEAAEINTGIASIIVSIERLNQEISVISEEIANCEAKAQEAKLKIENNKELTASFLKEIDALKEEAAALEKNIVEKETKRLEIENESERLNGEISDISAFISELSGENIRIEARRERHTEELNRLFNEMWEDYEITLKEAAKYEALEEAPAKLQKAAKELKNEIRALGNVNVSAIEQYKEAKERFEFLSGQKDDIIKAEEKLQGVISELTAIMEETFSKQFAIIAENFNVVFKEMFGGGRADLVLCDSENPLESGIEIVAEMPGKKLQSISLLSGGEKALTAIALLFGILRLKPSPFCILDEIEAALDDANIVRFASYLKRLKENTQFIVITHRKGTMESANVMYGVTMEEQGVSKLISIKLEEAAS